MKQPVTASPVELCKSADEYEASMIVALLADHDIPATMTGEFSAGFRAEAPGVVRVHVSQADLPLAQQLLSEARDQSASDDGNHKDLEESPEASQSSHDRFKRAIRISILLFLAFWLATVAFEVISGVFGFRK